jgi:hypothetical protein
MKYRKKPVVIEAEQFTDNAKDMVYNFVRCNSQPDVDLSGKPVLRIQTPEGVMTASVGDWVIKGIHGEFYPCKNDIFEQTYEREEDEREYRKVVINGEVIAGVDVKAVYAPEPGSIVWRILLENRLLYHASGNITCVELVEED